MQRCYCWGWTSLPFRFMLVLHCFHIAAELHSAQISVRRCRLMNEWMNEWMCIFTICSGINEQWKPASVHFIDWLEERVCFSWPESDPSVALANMNWLIKTLFILIVMLVTLVSCCGCNNPLKMRVHVFLPNNCTGLIRKASPQIK